MDSQGSEENAREVISGFLEGKDSDEFILNEGTGQRMILVARSFRKEVTSTVLWMISKGIDVKCIKVSLYSLDETLLLDINQIIPVKEAEEYMIGLSSKNNEERQTNAATQKTEKLRLRFWDELLTYFEKQNFLLYQNVSPSKVHWLNAGSGLSGCSFCIIFGRSEARVELYLSRAEKDENKKIYDFLYAHKQSIEDAFGAILIWERLDNKKACRIKYDKPFDSYNEENWPEIMSWMYEHMTSLERAIKPILDEVKL